MRSEALSGPGRVGALERRQRGGLVSTADDVVGDLARRQTISAWNALTSTSTSSPTKAGSAESWSGRVDERMGSR